MSELRISKKRFNWKTNYSECKEAVFALAEYIQVSSNYPDRRGGEQKSLAWFVMNPDTGETIMHVSRNVNVPRNQIAVKDYSENAGALDCLINLGIIQEQASWRIYSGWVEIPVHTLTEKGMEIVRELGFA